MSLFIPKKNTKKPTGAAVKDGNMVEQKRTVSYSSYKPIEKPGKPAQSAADRLASMSLEPIDPKSDDWNKKIDTKAFVGKVEVPTTHLPELRDVHKRRVYSNLPTYKVAADSRKINDLFDSLAKDDSAAPDKELEVDGLKVDLMDHQVEGVRFMRKREKQDISGGLLCDDMGLGKTVQSIALILKAKPKKDADIITTLVVCPLAVMDQWAEEIQTKAPKLAVATFQGSKRSRDPKELAKYNVIVTTYDIVVNEFKKPEESPLYNQTWFRIIADEAHEFRNPVTKKSLAMEALKSQGRRWALTGTPVHNGIDDLFSIFRFIKVEPYNDLKTWKSEIGDAINNKSGAKYTADHAIKILREILGSILLRRRQTVVKLPECNKVISKVTLRKDELEALSKLSTRPNSSTSPKESGDTLVVTRLLRMRQLCDDIALLSSNETEDEGSASGEDSTKTKVKEPIAKPAVAETPKKSNVDADNLAALLDDVSISSDSKKTTSRDDNSNKANSVDKKTKQEDVDDLAALLDDVSISKESDNLSSKTAAVLKIINTDNRRKTVIFSSFVTMLDRLARVLHDEGIGSKVYQGSLSASARKHILADFRTNEDVPVLLCSISCAAVGINITCASRVIMVDPWWNPMIVDQAINRVHRIGQKQKVDVFEMMAENTIEERIFALQDKKRELAEKMLEKQQKLSREEIDFLLYG